MSTETKVYDQYAPVLNYKKSITTLNRPFVTYTWIPIDHLRRIKAYEILTALYFNYSRDYRNDPESGDTSNNDSIWEMGNPAWFCDKFKDKLLGDELKISIKLPEDLRILDKRKAAGEQIEAGLQSSYDALMQRQAYLRQWFEDNNVALTIDENEEKCSYMGDCAYFVQWNEEDACPEIITYDPGFVFPFMGCNEDSIQEGGGFVRDRLVVAWEEDSESWGETEDKIILWQDIYELRVTTGKDGTKTLRCWRHSGYYKFARQDKVELQDVFDDALIQGDSEDTAGNAVAKWKDLGIDFIPVKLIPNRSIQGSEFGLSNLHFHIDLFDGIINNDTDLQKNTSYLGGAIVGMSGKEVSLKMNSTTHEPDGIEIAPNTVFRLGEGGEMTLLDTSRMQTALIDTLKYQIETLVRTSGITKIGIGEIETNTLSTLSIMMLMTPLLDKVNPRRKQRQGHYAQLFDMVQKLYHAFGTSEEKALFADPLYNVILEFGNIVPRNRQEDIIYYQALSGLVGEETALELARTDGLDIDVKLVLERKKKAEEERMKGEAEIFNARMGGNNEL